LISSPSRVRASVSFPATRWPIASAVREAARQVPRERLPQLGLAIEVGEQRPQLDRGRLVVEVDLDRRDRAVGLVRGQVRLRELLHDQHALRCRHRAEQALEPRYGLRRLAALDVEAGERTQRLGGR
jgi:hypothetical protein